MTLKQNLFLLRFLGYIGVQFNAILIPLIVYNFSKSIAMAGFVLAIEWAPKLFTYLGGGGVVTKLGYKQTHFLLELSRLFAFFIVFICSYQQYFDPIVIGVAAAIYQICNAFSNIIFERLVTQTWEPNNQSQGHTKMLLADQLACLGALLIGTTNLAIVSITVVALFFQLVTTLSLATLSSNYKENSTAKSSNSVELLKDSIKISIKSKKLFNISVLGLLINIPIAFVYSGLIFIIPMSIEQSKNATQILSFVLILKTVVSVVSLRLISNWLLNKTINFAKKLAAIGVTILALSCTGLLVYKTVFYTTIFFIICIGVSYLLIAPFLRALRQDIISIEVPEPLQNSVTGILMTIEASSYLAAAGLLFLSNQFR